MRISDWSSDVCSSDLIGNALEEERLLLLHDLGRDLDDRALALVERLDQPVGVREAIRKPRLRCLVLRPRRQFGVIAAVDEHTRQRRRVDFDRPARRPARDERSEEHTSELQSLMRISYAVFCLKKKKI